MSYNKKRSILRGSIQCILICALGYCRQFSRIYVLCNFLPLETTGGIQWSIKTGLHMQRFNNWYSRNTSLLAAMQFHPISPICYWSPMADYTNAECLHLKFHSQNSLTDKNCFLMNLFRFLHFWKIWNTADV